MNLDNLRDDAENLKDKAENKYNEAKGRFEQATDDFQRHHDHDHDDNGDHGRLGGDVTRDRYDEDTDAAHGAINDISDDTNNDVSDYRTGMSRDLEDDGL